VGLVVTFGRLSVSLLDSLVDVAHKDGRGQPRHTGLGSFKDALFCGDQTPTAESVLEHGRSSGQQDSAFAHRVAKTDSQNSIAFAAGGLLNILFWLLPHITALYGCSTSIYSEIYK